MTQEALRMALEFVKSINLGSRRASVEQQRQVITALEEALAQKREPVGHRDGYWCADLTCKKCYSADFHFKHKNSVDKESLTTPPQRTEQEPVAHWSDCAVHSEPAYPKGECDCGGFPPQRTWVGLTDEEIQVVAKQARSKDHAVTLTNKLLREKNNG